MSVLALAGVACGGGPGQGAAAGEASAEEVGFTADRLGGGRFDSASIEGSDTVLWFWAPWCTTCRGEAPAVVETAAEFEGSVQVIGVAGRGEVSEMEQFLADTGTGGLTHIVDTDGSIWSRYEVLAQPAFAFIDDSGAVEVHLGALGREELTERMEALAAA